MSEYYSYIFVRQDISPEQQLIQFGHAACVMGKNLPEHICPHNLNFVGIGVPNEPSLIKALFHIYDNDIGHHKFYEPDINNELTAIASSPIEGEKRIVFKNYKTLRFST
jgi:hypothetical protein